MGGAGRCKAHLSSTSGVDWPAIHRQLFFKYAMFFKVFWKLEGHDVLENHFVQFHLNLESHWDVDTAPCYVLDSNQIRHAVDPAANFLGNFQCLANGRFACLIFPDQQQ